MGLRGPGATPIRRLPQYAEEIGWKKGDTQTRVERVISFVESLPVTSGMLAGTMFKLRPWQKEIIEGIYGPEKDGKRLVREALLTFPRKNGKTGLSAALALCHLCGPEAVSRGQVYSAAAERDQAALIYNEMKAIVNAVSELSRRVIVRDFTKKLEDSVTGTTFQSISAVAKSKHGFSSSCWIYDELAQAKDRNLYDVLSTSTSAHEEPLGIVISTQSPDAKHIMSELVDYGQQVCDGIVEDPSFYARIYTAPIDADPWDEKTWFACNPALDDFRSLEEMRDFAGKAQRMPAKEATFRQLYLNQRVAAESRFVPKSDWDACGMNIDLDSLEGAKCYGGLDLSGKNDLTALVLVFPQDDGVKVSVPFFWTPQEQLEEAEGRDRAPYKLWVKQKHLLTTPGRIMDYRTVALKIAELSKKYNIEGIMFDRWKIDWLIRELDAVGADIKLIECGQGFKDMDPAIQLLEDDILDWKMRHNRNPVMDWCLDNVRVSLDAAGNRKFDKQRAIGRIDGAQALAMANSLTASDKSQQDYQVFFVG